MKRHTTRLALNRETLRTLTAEYLRTAAGAAEISIGGHAATCVTCIAGTCTCRECDRSTLVC